MLTKRPEEVLLYSESPLHAQHQIRQASVLPTLPYLVAESYPQMDLVLIAIAEAGVERERQRIRQMEQSLRADDAALQEKEREREMLKTNKEEMLTDEAAKEKLVDEFMVFIEAIKNNDPMIAQNLYEKSMTNTILTMMKSDGDDGGIVGGDNVPKIKQDVEEKPTMDATLATNNSDGNFGGKFVGGNGGINNAFENAHTLCGGGTMAAIQGTNSDGSGAGGASGISDSGISKRH